MSERTRNPSRLRIVRWRIEYLAYRAMETVIGWLPGGMASRLGCALGAMGHRFMGKRRRTVLRNLRAAFSGEKTMAEIESLAREVFRRNGANLIASLHTATLDRAGLEKALEVVGMDTFRSAVHDGRGVVVVLAHMGNWEALAQKFPLLIPEGYRGATVYRPLNNPFLNKRVEDTRRQAGTGLFSKQDSPLAMMSFLREGGVLGMLCDQRAGNTGEFVPFFGRLTSCTPLPSVFARRTRAHVLGVSLATIAPGRWRLSFHELKGEPTTAGCMALLEELIRTSPADVFWMQDRWRPGRRNPLVLEGKPAKGAPGQSVKPRRVLVWLHDGQLPRSALPAGVPDDISYEYALPRGEARPAWLDREARVHEWTAGRIDRSLARADAFEVMPLNAVITFSDDAVLAEACRNAGIRIHKLAAPAS